MAKLNRVSVVVLAIALGLLELGLPRAAHAGIGACGDIDVEASATCTVIAPSASCEAMCTPVSIRAACTAQLAAECRGDCSDLPSIDCHGECSASCKADCDADPGSFDCHGACSADCSGRCGANCKADDDQAACEASCEGSCNASCDVSCEGEPPMVECDAGCEASCEGSCEADANFDCQVDCQAEGKVDCEAEVKGGCEVDCQSMEGALFCDGQYIDRGDNLKACIDALRAELNIKVQSSAEGSSECVGGECRAEGRASAKVSGCAVAEPGSERRDFSALFGGIGLLAWLRLRRRTGHV